MSGPCGLPEITGTTNSKEMENADMSHPSLDTLFFILHLPRSTGEMSRLVFELYWLSRAGKMESSEMGIRNFNDEAR